MVTMDPALLQQRLTNGRRAAEMAMRDTFGAYSHTTVKIDGFDQDQWTLQDTTVGKLSGRSQQGDTNTRTVTVGGIERPVVDGGLHIPLASSLPEIGWEYVCTAVGPSSDPALLGRRWRVVDVPAKSHATARRLDVVEVPQ